LKAVQLKAYISQYLNYNDTSTSWWKTAVSSSAGSQTLTKESTHFSLCGRWTDAITLPPTYMAVRLNPLSNKSLYKQGDLPLLVNFRCYTSTNRSGNSCL
jgi:hypothetical protein